MRAIFQWNLGSRVLELGRRTLIMGVVNVTPDSFSDGGLYIDAEKAVVRAEQLLDEGASHHRHRWRIDAAGNVGIRRNCGRAL